jgi:large subunit ribosomal protein L4
VEVSDVAGLNPLNLVRYEHVVVTVGAVRAIEEWLS